MLFYLMRAVSEGKIGLLPSTILNITALNLRRGPNETNELEAPGLITVGLRRWLVAGGSDLAIGSLDVSSIIVSADVSVRDFQIPFGNGPKAFTAHRLIQNLYKYSQVFSPSCLGGLNTLLKK